MQSVITTRLCGIVRDMSTKSPRMRPHYNSIHISSPWLTDKFAPSTPEQRTVETAREENDEVDHVRGNTPISIKPNVPVQKLLDSAVTETNFKPETPEAVWYKTPYDSHKQRQSLKAYRPKVDPRETTIILFPGQGVQKVGMCKHLLKIPSVRELFKTANKVLGYDLLDLCLNGPQEKLDRTEYCQPAVFVASVAALQLMMEERKGSVERCVATAGFSLGEFAALVFAGALNFETALRLVKIRAEAMQAACEEVNSGMITCLLQSAAKIGKITEASLKWCSDRGVENPVCAVASYLWPECKVIAGNIEALEFIEKNTKQLGIRMAKRIPVSGAFHTELMKPAAEKFAEALYKCDINDPLISVHSNVDGRIYTDASSVKHKLPRQIYRPVKWEQIMHIMYEREKMEHYPTTFECGPGNSLVTMLQRVDAKAAKDSVNIFA